ncbi:MAG: DUF1460 domain-containing protein [Verrucomicrobia bacterium]|nr:MAG: DUF1460 domain-containing protein [Verrucomicrobiota bacterium]
MQTVFSLQLALIATFFFLSGTLLKAARLPDDVVFAGKSKFNELVRRGATEGWAKLPLGERTGRVGMALLGTPYKNYTLELDDRIETPSVNMLGMDCWTFFEIALGTARAFHIQPVPTPSDLLHMIELDRYRGGKCTGVFTSRLHHLEDWLYDNQKRGLVREITPSLRGARRINRQVRDMAVYWRSSRQLRANPQLIPVIAKIEKILSDRGIWYLPKNFVPAAEAQLKTGDVICIVSKHLDDYTTHVGLAYRDQRGVLRFLHASKNYRCVTLDRRLSDYLNHFKSDAGIMVARPLEITRQ